MDFGRCKACDRLLMKMTERTGRSKLVCVKCDRIDPMKTAAANWANAGLAKPLPCKPR